MALNLQHLHNRLEQGEHILVVDWGNITEAVFSIWYAEDNVGKYLQIVGQDGAFFYKITMDGANEVKAAPISFKDGQDIRNFEAPSTDLRFLEPDRLEVKEDKFSQTKRLIRDYQTLLPMVNPSYIEKAPYLNYRTELASLIEKYPEDTL